MMYHCCAMLNVSSVHEKFNYALDDPAGGAIYAEEKDPEKRDRHHHDPSGDKHLVPRRPSHLAHFNAHFMQERAPATGVLAQVSQGGIQGVPAAVVSPPAANFFVFHLQCFRHNFNPILPESACQAR